MLPAMWSDTRPRSDVLVRLALAAGVAGVLVAAFLLPLVGGAGLLARASVPPPGELPAELTGEVSGNSRVLAADGTCGRSWHLPPRGRISAIGGCRSSQRRACSTARRIPSSRVILGS